MTQPTDPVVTIFVDVLNAVDQIVTGLTTVLQEADPALEAAAPIVELVGYALEGVGESLEPYCPLIGELIGLGLAVAGLP